LGYQFIWTKAPSKKAVKKKRKSGGKHLLYEFSETKKKKVKEK